MLHITSERKGKPFKDEEKLKETRAKLDEYRKLMKEELEAKEKKYADAMASSDSSELESEMNELLEADNNTDEDVEFEIESDEDYRPLEESPESQLAFDTVTELLDRAGVETELLTNEEMEQLADNAQQMRGQKKALETALPEDESSFKGTVVSSASGTKVLNNLDNLASEYENSNTKNARTFIGDLARVLGASTKKTDSQYSTFETVNGDIVTIRLADHNASSVKMDNAGRDNAISIVISRKSNDGIEKGGKAHIVEFFYSDKALRESNGKPLVEIIKGIKQSLYSGVYKDTTGLAEVQEVNAENIPELMTVYHGSAAKFDHFDHSFMGTGEGAQAYGWGTYVSEVKGIGKSYAQTALNNALSREVGKNQSLLSKLFSRSPRRELYTVSIPDDVPGAYLKWHGEYGTKTTDAIDEELRKLGYSGINPERSRLYGGIIYQRISNRLGSDKYASILLARMGLVGIKVPTNFSRRVEAESTSNYVIFKESDLKIKDRIEFLKNGSTVYGAAVGGKILLNAERLNPNTPVHEYTHLWDKAVQQKNPELWKRGVELMKQTSVWQEVANDPNYAGLDENGIASEVHSRLAGDKGEVELERMSREVLNSNGGILDKAAKMSVIQKLRKWLSEFWYWVKNTLTPWSAEEAERVSLDDFVNMPIADLAKGTRFDIASMETPIHESKGTFKNLAEAEDWAEENLKGKSAVNQFTGDTISIGRNSIDKMLSQKAHEKSVSVPVHLSALRSVLDFIRTGIPAEVHLDNKGRGFEVMRLYNAFTYKGELYRVKSTVRKIAQGDRYYTYEVQEMELIEERRANRKGEGQNPRDPNNSINSITGAKLLKGVKKTNSDELILPEDNDIRFQIGAKRKEEMRQGLRSKLTEASADAVENTINEIEKLGEQSKKGGDSRIEKLAYHWAKEGTIILPEDSDKVMQAADIAAKKKLDAFKYRSPMELINENLEAIKEKPINPDNVSTLTNKVEYEDGITIYDVQDSEESRQNMRKIINTHFGKDCSPWCLLQGDGKGNLRDDSAQYWQHYNKYPKRVAFRNGKLLAFFASADKPTWWDRQDNPHNGIPVVKKMEDGIVAQFIFNEEEKEWEEPVPMYRGNKQNGLYEEFFPNGNVQSRVNYKDGKPNGRSEYFYPNGQLRDIENYSEGLLDGRTETYYNIESRTMPLAEVRNYKDGKLEGYLSTFDYEGELITLKQYRDGRLNGVSEVYYNNGQVARREFFGDGKRNGEFKEWRPNGQLKDLRQFREDKQVGKHFNWDKDGNLIYSAEYNNDGKLEGVESNRETDGKWTHRIYKNGEMVEETISNQYEQSEPVRFREKKSSAEETDAAYNEAVEKGDMAQNAGYDGVIFSNIKDGATRETQDIVANDYVAFDPSAIKSADAVTRNDEGNVIPLSERFNEGSEDIRFREDGQERLKDKRSKLLNTTPVVVKKEQIVGQKGVKGERALDKALNWFSTEIGKPLVFSTEIGNVVFDEQSVRSSLAHKYGQAKLDALLSIPDGFPKSTYLTTMADMDGKNEENSYFAYPIIYDGQRMFVICRTKKSADSNSKRRIYIHEVFSEDTIKEHTLHSAAGENRQVRGMLLYANLLKEVLGANLENKTDKTSEDNILYKTEDRKPFTDSPVTNHSVSLDGMRNAGQQMSESLGVEVVFIKDSELPEGHHGAMGMWKGGKVYVKRIGCRQIREDICG